jgi:hypothetical protein
MNEPLDEIRYVHRDRSSASREFVGESVEVSIGELASRCDVAARSIGHRSPA